MQFSKNDLDDFEIQLRKSRADSEIEIESEATVEIHHGNQTPVKGANSAKQCANKGGNHNNTPKRYTSLKDLKCGDKTVLKQSLETEEGTKGLKALLLRTGKVKNCKY